MIYLKNLKMCIVIFMFIDRYTLYIILDYN
jgi:hypothetical protein